MKRLLLLGVVVLMLGIITFLFLPHSQLPGSCKILTQADCQKVQFGTYFKGQDAIAAAYTLPAGAPLFAPFSSSSIVGGPIKLVTVSGKTVTFQNIILSTLLPSSNKQTPSKNLVYSILLPLGTIDTKALQTVQAGKIFGRIASAQTNGYTVFIVVTTASLNYGQGIVKNLQKPHDITKMTLSPK